MFEKTYGGAGFEDAHVVHEILGEGYIIAGTSSSFGNGSNDCMLLKIDIYGNQQWLKTYGGSGDEDSHYGIITYDGGFALIAYSNSFGNGDYDFYLIKTDNNGDTLWTKTYGDATNEYAYCMQQTPDSGFVLVGKKEDAVTGAFDIWLIKTDAQGTIEWDTTYGDSLDDYGRFIELTSDGGFIIAGTSYNTDSSDAEMYLIKTNNTGQVEWESKFDQSIQTFGYSVQQTYDGGFVIAGYSYDANMCWGADRYNLVVVKTDSLGNEDWRSIPFPNWGYECMTYAAHSIRITSDSGFIVCGMAHVELICKTTADPDTGLPYASNMLMLKLDQNGDVDWSREYPWGNNGYNELGTYGIETSDGGFIFTAYQGLNYTTEGDALVVKTNSSGVIIGLDEKIADKLSIDIYPNPANNILTLDPATTEKYSFSIYDGLGRRVLSDDEAIGKSEIIIATFNDGVYYLRIQSNNKLINKKIIITR